MSQSAY